MKTMRKHYETPATEVVEVVMHGMLAQSGEVEELDQMGRNNYNYEEW